MITNECIISYPTLFEAVENQSGQLKYSCCLLVPKSDTEGVAKLEAAIEKAIARGRSTKWGGKLPRFTYKPLRDGDEEVESGEKDPGKGYEGHYFINCSSTEAPGVVGPNGAPLMDQKSIYAGCTVRADIGAFPYKHSGNAGVGWWLNHVMLVHECEPEERLDGKQTAENAFAEFVKPEEDGLE